MCRGRRAHHYNRIVDACLTKRDALVDCRDAESVDSQLLQGAREFERPMAIGIGLDDGEHLSMRCETAHMSEILRESIQID